MRLSTLFAVSAGVVLVAAAACHNDSSAPTQPAILPAVTPTPAAVLPTPTPPPAGGTTRTVNIGPGSVFLDSQTMGSTTTIKTGDTVQWNFVDSIPHSTTSGNCCTASGLWDSGIKGSGSFSHKFTATGTFPYFCSVHGAMMTGTVIVNP